MRYAIFGDIHGNLEGLQAVAAAIEQRGVDAWICVGDIVGYGADPNACCDFLRDRDVICLFGNHDEACIGRGNVSWFNQFARAAAEWTRETLDPDHREWLGTLQPIRRVEDFLVVHSSLPDPWEWTYVTTPEIAADTMDASDCDVIFVGHTHIAEVYRRVANRPIRKGSLRLGGEVFINDHNRYVINPGSAGQPRDRNWQVSFGIYDTTARRVSVERVDYDVDAAADKIILAGLPEGLGMRLMFGR